MQMPRTRSARRRAAAVGAALGLMVLGASMLSDASAAPGRRAAPILRLTRRDPVTVSGRHFQPRRRVHVRLVDGRTLIATAVATGSGGFTVSFPTVVDRCSSFSISATQEPRAHVVLHGFPKPECLPASAP